MCPTILTLSKRQKKKKKKYTKSPKKLQILPPRGYDTHSNIIHQIYLIFFFNGWSGFTHCARMSVWSEI